MFPDTNYNPLSGGCINEIVVEVVMPPPVVLSGDDNIPPLSDCIPNN